VLLVRHAESTWNALRLWQGQGDPPLSERGREQAASLGARFVEAGIERIVSSDLRRAAETAGIVGARINVAVTLDPRLREHDVGAWSGLSHEEIARRWPDEFARFRAGDPDVALGGGESNRLLRSRVRAALEALRADAAGHVLAVVTHAGVIRALAGPVTVENAATVWWDGVPVDE
jgi:broad specificity phosphatase PhoE